MALAFTDNAFEDGFSSPQVMYKLLVGAKTDRVRLLWKNEWRERPIFRDVRHTAEGVCVAADKALQYAKERHHFIRLGRSCGYAKKLEFYDLCRASGKKLNGESTPWGSTGVGNSSRSYYRGGSCPSKKQNYGTPARRLNNVHPALHACVYRHGLPGYLPWKLSTEGSDP